MGSERQPLSRWLDGFADQKILVLGDLMLDTFTWGRVRRISPEAPVPIVEIEHETHTPGGAANVAANIQALGGCSRLVGVLGRDGSARRLQSLLLARGIDPTHVVEAERKTTVKTRVIAHGQQVVRTDREDTTPLEKSVVDAVAERFESALQGAGAVIVSDYAKGVIHAALLDAVLPKAKDADVPVFLDPKVEHAEFYHHITLMAPNERETAKLAGLEITDGPSLERAGETLRDRFGCPHILVTRGENGMALFDADRIHRIPATAREVFDVTGAGDTVMATMALAHAAGATMVEAASLANDAAGIVVGKLGTAVVTREEIASLLKHSG